jgi:hypothetical protein
MPAVSLAPSSARNSLEAANWISRKHPRSAHDRCRAASGARGRRRPLRSGSACPRITRAELTGTVTVTTAGYPGDRRTHATIRPGQSQTVQAGRAQDALTLVLTTTLDDLG